MLRTQIPSFFKSRRDQLISKNPKAAFIFPATPIAMRNPDVDYPFRQESSFFYLTGFEEPESILVIAAGKSFLFVQERNPEMEIWEGERYGFDRAKSLFSMDDAWVNTEFDAKLPTLLKDCDQVHYGMGLNAAMDTRVVALLDKHRKLFGRSGKPMLPILDPRGVLGEMRLFKTPEEAAVLRKACQITAEAHTDAMKTTRPGMNESEVEAMIDYNLRRRGCQRVGYGSIVAGGNNATCLHYRANNEALSDGDLLLIDAGGEHEYYTSDITRTFPVGKKFSTEQAAIYDIVLRAQKEVIAMIKPGLVYKTMHERATEILVDGLVALGLLKGDRAELIKSGAHRRFYPHGTGHYLGMDVHDVGLYGESQTRPIEVGMCFTVEPGLYVQPGDLQAPENYRGIGIRIEDDILVTANGCEVLTAGVVKERADIEALRAKSF